MYDVFKGVSEITQIEFVMCLWHTVSIVELTHVRCFFLSAPADGMRCREFKNKLYYLISKHRTESLEEIFFSKKKNRNKNHSPCYFNFFFFSAGSNQHTTEKKFCLIKLANAAVVNYSTSSPMGINTTFLPMNF